MIRSDVLRVVDRVDVSQVQNAEKQYLQDKVASAIMKGNRQFIAPHTILDQLDLPLSIPIPNDTEQSDEL